MQLYCVSEDYKNKCVNDDDAKAVEALRDTPVQCDLQDAVSRVLARAWYCSLSTQVKASL